MLRGGRRNPLAPFKTKKMIKKTYGVKGLVEWFCEVESGSAKFRFPFTGGAITAIGITPAEYTTDNPVKQYVIEHSSYYQSGKIYVLRKEDITVTDAERKQIAEAPVASTDDLQVIQVTCTEDAKQYMREHYGCNAADVRSKLQITRLAAEKGIRFEGWD